MIVQNKWLLKRNKKKSQIEHIIAIIVAILGFVMCMFGGIVMFLIGN